MDFAVAIRSVQHYLYCPHRWGLLEIGKVWAENAFVVKGNLLHKRVHDSDSSYSIREKNVFTSVSIYNDKPQYKIYGVADCIEVTRSNSANDYCVVEYKPTKPKDAEYNHDDAMQVFAQKVCVDYVFNTSCNAVLYYTDVKKRVFLPFDTEYESYDRELKSLLSEMREYLEKGRIPQIKAGQNCSGCSLGDLCMPKIKKIGSIRTKILESLENDK